MLFLSASRRPTLDSEVTNEIAQLQEGRDYAFETTRSLDASLNAMFPRLQIYVLSTGKKAYIYVYLNVLHQWNLELKESTKLIVWLELRLITTSMLQPIVFRSSSKLFAYVHVRPYPRSTENTTLRWWWMGWSIDKWRNEWPINQSINPMRITWPNGRRLDFSQNVFVSDAVLPVDAECSANHLPMSGIVHAWRGQHEGRDCNAYATIISTAALKSLIFNASCFVEWRIWHSLPMADLAAATIRCMTALEEIVGRLGGCSCHIHISFFHPTSKLFRDHSHIRHIEPLCSPRSISNLPPLNKIEDGVNFFQGRRRSHCWSYRRQHMKCRQCDGWMSTTVSRFQRKSMFIDDGLS